MKEREEYRKKLHELYAAERFEEALELVLQEEGTNPNDTEVLKAKAALLGILEREEEALAVLAVVLPLNPKDHELYRMKGVSLYRLGKYPEAVEEFKSCLVFRPHDPIAAEQRISALILMGKYSEAVREYEVSDLPDFEEEIWLNNLGYTYMKLGNNAEALSILSRARRINPLSGIVHGNLALLHKSLKHQVLYFLHGAISNILSWLEGIPQWQKYVNNRTRPHISESDFFSGSGSLFSSSSLQRETRTILKLLRGANAPALCNDWWNWFAVNIPYSAVEKNGVEGDIDIIVKRPRNPGGIDGGFTYRGFEVKAIKVDKNGRIKSAKRGKAKLRGIEKQLGLLKKFGCEQIFLLEIFVLERGYSALHSFPSREIQAEILEKAKYLKQQGYGYVITAEEPTTTHDEESGGMLHMVRNILPAVSNPISTSFQNLMDGIDAFLTKPETRALLSDPKTAEKFGTKVGYCRKCKQLTMLLPQGVAMHVCGHCKRPMY
jgi:Flp pilus assembly protein TadD